MRSLLLPIAALLLCAAVASSQDSTQTRTRVDWSAGTVTITISRPVPASRLGNPTAISDLQREMVRDAPAIIAGELYALLLDSWSTLGFLLRQEESVIETLLHAAESARRIDERALVDLRGAIVTFELSIWRDLIPRFTSHARAASIARRLGWVPTKRYSGIVIYAADPLPVHGTGRRELLQPAMLPGLYYLAGSAELVRIAEAENYDPAALATWGAFGYTDSIAEAELDRRAGPDPLRIVAYGAFGRMPADIVLHERDALAILTNADNVRLITEGRIVVIVAPSVLVQDLRP